MLVPLLSCVRQVDAVTWQAVFGYAYSGGAASPLVLAPSTETNWLLSAHTDNQPQPSVFYPRTQFADAFEALFSRDEELQWRVRANASATWRIATASRTSHACDSDEPLLAEPVQPIAEGCVSRVGGVCRAVFGYYNPNARTMEVAVANGQNAVSPAPEDRRQPRVFLPGYVSAAWTVEFACSGADADWALVWRLGTRAAVVNETNVC